MDKRKNKIKIVWGSGFWGKVLVVVVSAMIISVIVFGVAIPVKYETKANAAAIEKKCVEKVRAAEDRQCDKNVTMNKRISKNEEHINTMQKDLLIELGKISRSVGRIEGKMDK